MGILDEAIREHLELKRAHGADDSELKQLEDDAFGPPQRPGGDQEPDPVAEAATEFMAQPDLAADEEKPQRRESPAGIADLQEAPELPAEEPVEEDEPEAEDELEPVDDERPPGTPSVEDQPAGEHEAVPEISSGPNTEERHAIADQPTEMFDVEEEFASSEAAAPADEELVAEEISEPRLAPAPDTSVEAEDDEDDEEDFFDHQRLSDELDQALEAPLEDEPESAEHEVVEEPASPASKEHDALEETPDFLEEAPEDDELWFEQKPPKDFDFDG